MNIGHTKISVDDYEEQRKQFWGGLQARMGDQQAIQQMMQSGQLPQGFNAEGVWDGFAYPGGQKGNLYNTPATGDATPGAATAAPAPAAPGADQAKAMTSGASGGGGGGGMGPTSVPGAGTAAPSI